MRSSSASLGESQKAPAIWISAQCCTCLSLLISCLLGFFGSNQSWDPYVMAGMTTVLYRSLRLEGVILVIVFPSTLSLATVAIPFLWRREMWCLNESLQSRWEPSQRMEEGGVMVRGLPYRVVLSAGHVSCRCQEKCMRSHLSGSMDIPILVSVSTALLRDLQSRSVLVSRSSEMARNPKSST